MKIQPLLARPGQPSVDVAKLAGLLKDCATLNELICIQSPEHWREVIAGLDEDVDALLPVSSPCYPTEIWNSCPEPLVERGLPVIFWPLLEYDEPDFWKWSARDFLRALGVEVYLVENHASGLARVKALAMRRFLRHSRLIVFGEQNFPWNAHAAGKFVKQSLGTSIEVRPLPLIRQRAGGFSDTEIDRLWRERQKRYQVLSVRPEELKTALRVYLAVKSILDDEKAFGFGVNCFGDLITGGGRDVPCLAQCLAREDGYIASCDGDFCALMSMALATYYLDRPCMMSNLYPLGYVGALTEHFGNPLAAPAGFAPAAAANLARLAHCGYSGVVPPEMSATGQARLTDWGGTYEIKRDGRGCGIDCGLAGGQRFTGLELCFDGKTLLLTSGEVVEETRHSGMPHCEATILLRLADLPNLIKKISREHLVLVYGEHVPELELLAQTLFLNPVCI